MNRYLYFSLFGILFTLSSVSAQSTYIYRYGDLEQRILNFKFKSDSLSKQKKYEEGMVYYDSIKNIIINSKLDKYTFKDIDESKYVLGENHLPILMQVTASWCAPCRAEIPVLNQLAKEFKGKIDIVLLFWDNKEQLSKLREEYNPLIKIIPSEVDSNDFVSINISGFKHYTGYPTNFYVQSNLLIQNFSMGGVVPDMTFTNPDGTTISFTKDQAFEMNYNRIKSEITNLIANNK